MDRPMLIPPLLPALPLLLLPFRSYPDDSVLQVRSKIGRGKNQKYADVAGITNILGLRRSMLHRWLQETDLTRMMGRSMATHVLGR